MPQSNKFSNVSLDTIIKQAQEIALQSRSELKDQKQQLKIRADLLNGELSLLSEATEVKALEDSRLRLEAETAAVEAASIKLDSEIKAARKMIINLSLLADTPTVSETGPLDSETLSAATASFLSGESKQVFEAQAGKEAQKEKSLYQQHNLESELIKKKKSQKEYEGQISVLAREHQQNAVKITILQETKQELEIELKGFPINADGLTPALDSRSQVTKQLTQRWDQAKAELKEIGQNSDHIRTLVAAYNGGPLASVWAKHLETLAAQKEKAVVAMNAKIESLEQQVDESKKSDVQTESQRESVTSFLKDKCDEIARIDAELKVEQQQQFDKESSISSLELLLQNCLSEQVKSNALLGNTAAKVTEFKAQALKKKTPEQRIQFMLACKNAEHARGVERLRQPDFATDVAQSIGASIKSYVDIMPASKEIIANSSKELAERNAQLQAQLAHLATLMVSATAELKGAETNYVHECNVRQSAYGSELNRLQVMPKFQPMKVENYRKWVGGVGGWWMKKATRQRSVPDGPLVTQPHIQDEINKLNEKNHAHAQQMLADHVANVAQINGKIFQIDQQGAALTGYAWWVKDYMATNEDFSTLIDQNIAVLKLQEKAFTASERSGQLARKTFTEKHEGTQKEIDELKACLSDPARLSEYIKTLEPEPATDVYDEPQAQSAPVAKEAKTESKAKAQESEPTKSPMPGEAHQQALLKQQKRILAQKEIKSALLNKQKENLKKQSEENKQQSKNVVEHLKKSKETLSHQLENLEVVKAEIIQKEEAIDTANLSYFETSLLTQNISLSCFNNAPKAWTAAEVSIANLLQIVFERYPEIEDEQINGANPSENWKRHTSVIFEKFQELKKHDENVVTKEMLVDIVKIMNQVFASDSSNLKINPVESTHANMYEVSNGQRSFQLLHPKNSKQSYLLHPSSDYMTQGQQAARLLNSLILGEGEQLMQSVCQQQIETTNEMALKAIDIDDLLQFAETYNEQLLSITSFAEFNKAFIQEGEKTPSFALATSILERLAAFTSEPYFKPFLNAYLKVLIKTVNTEIARRQKEQTKLAISDPLKKLEAMIAEKEKEILDNKLSSSESASKIRQNVIDIVALESAKVKILEGYNKQINQCDAEIKGLEKKAEELGIKIAGLNGELESQVSEKNTLKASQASVKITLETLKSKKSTLQAEVAKHTAELKRHAGVRGRLDVEQKKIQVDIDRAKTNAAEIKMDVTRVRAICLFVEKLKDAVKDSYDFQKRKPELLKQIKALQTSEKPSAKGLYDLLMKQPEFNQLESKGLAESFENAGDLYRDLLDVFVEISAGPKLETIARERKLKITGFNLDWRACQSEINSHILKQINQYGLKFNDEGFLVIANFDLFGGVEFLPKNIRALIEKRIEAQYVYRRDVGWKEKSTYRDHSVAVLKALKVDFSDILHCFYDHIEVAAENALFVDPEQGKDITLPGISLTLFSKNAITVVNKSSIVTSGKSAAEFVTIKALNGKEYRAVGRPNGDSADHGLNGFSGHSAGDIYIKASSIKGLEKLSCTAKGGKGASGQQGGDGDQGRQGLETHDAIASETGYVKAQSYQAVARIPGIGANNITLLNEVSGPGGDGGLAGLGGEGGLAGSIFIEDLKRSFKREAGDELVSPVPEMKGLLSSTPGDHGSDAKLTARGGPAGDGGFIGADHQRWKKGFFFKKTKTKKGIFEKSQFTQSLDGSDNWGEKMAVALFMPGVNIFCAAFGFFGSEESVQSFSHDYSMQYSRVGSWYCARTEISIGDYRKNPHNSTYKRSLGVDKSENEYGKRSETTRNKAKPQSAIIADQAYNEYLNKAVKSGSYFSTTECFVTKSKARITRLDARLQAANEKFSRCTQASAKVVEGIGLISKSVDGAKGKLKSAQDRVNALQEKISEKHDQDMAMDATLVEKFKEIEKRQAEILSLTTDQQWAHIDAESQRGVRQRFTTLYHSLKSQIDLHIRNKNKSNAEEKIAGEGITAKLKELLKELDQLQSKHAQLKGASQDSSIKEFRPAFNHNARSTQTTSTHEIRIEKKFSTNDESEPTLKALDILLTGGDITQKQYSTSKLKELYHKSFSELSQERKPKQADLSEIKLSHKNIKLYSQLVVLAVNLQKRSGSFNSEKTVNLLTCIQNALGFIKRSPVPLAQECNDSLSLMKKTSRNLLESCEKSLIASVNESGERDCASQIKNNLKRIFNVKTQPENIDEIDKLLSKAEFFRKILMEPVEDGLTLLFMLDHLPPAHWIDSSKEESDCQEMLKISRKLGIMQAGIKTSGALYFDIALTVIKKQTSLEKLNLDDRLSKGGKKVRPGNGWGEYQKAKKVTKFSKSLQACLSFFDKESLKTEPRGSVLRNLYDFLAAEYEPTLFAQQFAEIQKLKDGGQLAEMLRRFSAEYAELYFFNVDKEDKAEEQLSQLMDSVSTTASTIIWAQAVLNLTKITPLPPSWLIFAVLQKVDVLEPRALALIMEVKCDDDEAIDIKTRLFDIKLKQLLGRKKLAPQPVMGRLASDIAKARKFLSFDRQLEILQQLQAFSSVEKLDSEIVQISRKHLAAELKLDAQLSSYEDMLPVSLKSPKMMDAFLYCLERNISTLGLKEVSGIENAISNVKESLAKERDASENSKTLLFASNVDALINQRYIALIDKQYQTQRENLEKDSKKHADINTHLSRFSTFYNVKDTVVKGRKREFVRLLLKKLIDSDVAIDKLTSVEALIAESNKCALAEFKKEALFSRLSPSNTPNPLFAFEWTVDYGFKGCSKLLETVISSLKELKPSDVESLNQLKLVVNELREYILRLHFSDSGKQLHLQAWSGQINAILRQFPDEVDESLRLQVGLLQQALSTAAYEMNQYESVEQLAQHYAQRNPLFKRKKALSTIKKNSLDSLPEVFSGLTFMSEEKARRSAFCTDVLEALTSEELYNEPLKYQDIIQATVTRRLVMLGYVGNTKDGIEKGVDLSALLDEVMQRVKEEKPTESVRLFEKLFSSLNTYADKPSELSAFTEKFITWFNENRLDLTGHQFHINAIFRVLNEAQRFLIINDKSIPSHLTAIRSTLLEINPITQSPRLLCLYSRLYHQLLLNKEKTDGVLGVLKSIYADCDKVEVRMIKYLANAKDSNADAIDDLDFFISVLPLIPRSLMSDESSEIIKLNLQKKQTLAPIEAKLLLALLTRESEMLIRSTFTAPNDERVSAWLQRIICDFNEAGDRQGLYTWLATISECLNSGVDNQQVMLKKLLGKHKRLAKLTVADTWLSLLVPHERELASRLPTKIIANIILTANTVSLNSAIETAYLQHIERDLYNEIKAQPEIKHVAKELNDFLQADTYSVMLEKHKALLLPLGELKQDDANKLRSMIQFVKECKGLLIRGLKESRSRGEASEWCDFMSELLPKAETLGLNNVSRIMVAAQVFPDLKKLTALLKNTKVEKVTQIALCERIKIIAGRNNKDVMEGEVSVYDALFTEVYASPQGLAFLTLLGHRLYASLKHDSSRINLELLQEILEIANEMEVFSNPGLLARLENVGYSSWLSALKRHKLQLRLRITSKTEKGDSIVDSFIAVQKEAKPEIFEQWLTHISELSNVDTSLLKSVVESFASKKWSLDETTLAVMCDNPIESWFVRLSANDSLGAAERSPKKLIELMLHDSRGMGESLKQSLAVGELKGEKTSTYEKLLERIARKYKDYEALNDAEILKKSKGFRAKQGFLRNNAENQYDDIVDFLAVAMRVSKKECGYTLRNTQLLAVMSYIDAFNTSKGRLANINTGEGKTLITVIAAIASVFRGESVDVVTSSPVLAIEGEQSSEKLFKSFGVSVSNNCDKEALKCEKERKKRYQSSEVMYGDVGSFQRDLLLTKHMDVDIRPKTASTVIIDEVDSTLIDNLDRVLYISHDISEFSHLRELFGVIWVYANARQNSTSFEANVEFIQKHIALQLKNNIIKLPKSLDEFVQRRLKIWIKNAFYAKRMEKGKEYTIAQTGEHAGKPIIMDLPTGVEQLNSNWSNGLHQFIQLKHQAKLTNESLKAVYTSNLNYFKLYGANVYGMSGTLGSQSEKDLLSETYGVDFFRVPRFQREKYIQEPGVVCKTDEDWLRCISKDILEKSSKTEASSPESKEAKKPQKERRNKKISKNKKLTQSIAQANTELETTEAAIKKQKKKIATDTGQLTKAKQKSVQPSTTEDERKALITQCTDLDLDIIKGLGLLEGLSKQVNVLKTKIKQLKFRQAQTEVTLSGNQSRASLIICEDQKSASAIYTHIKQTLKNGGKIYKYDSSLGDNELPAVRPGDVIVATNIAGRGTDINAKLVNQFGGLNVLLSYMPSNIRIEQQAFGRTARAGQKGSGKFIVRDSRVGATIERLRDERDNIEADRLNDIKDRMIPRLQLEEALFKKLATLQEKVKKHFSVKWVSSEVVKLEVKSLLNRWAFWLDEREDQFANTDDACQKKLTSEFSDFEESINKDIEAPGGTLIDSYGELMKLARIKFKREEYHGAEGCYDKIIEAEPHFSGFAHYYKAQAIIKQGSGIGNKVSARRELKKAILYFEAAKYRLSTLNSCVEGISCNTPDKLKGADVSLLNESISGEVGILEIHLKAAREAAGSSLSVDDLAGPSIGNNPEVLFSRILDWLGANQKSLIKSYRVSKKAGIKKDEGSGLEYLTYDDSAVDFPEKYMFCKSEVIDLFRGKILAQSLKGRTLSTADLSQFVFSQKDFIELLGSRLNKERKFSLTSEAKNISLGEYVWRDKLFLNKGIKLKKFILELKKDSTSADVLPELKKCVKATDDQAENILKKLITLKILSQDVVYSFTDELSTTITSYGAKFSLSSQKPKASLSQLNVSAIEGLQGKGDAIVKKLESAWAESSLTFSPAKLHVTQVQFSALCCQLQKLGLLEYSLGKDLSAQTSPESKALATDNTPKPYHYKKIEEAALALLAMGGKFKQTDIPLGETSEKEAFTMLNFLAGTRVVKTPAAKFKLNGKKHKDPKGEIEKIKDKIGAALCEVFKDAEIKSTDKRREIEESMLEALEKSIGKIRSLPKLKLNNKRLDEYFEHGKLPPEVIDYVKNACDSVLTVSEDRGYFSWDTFVCAVIGLVQIAAGVLILASSGSPMGKLLISEGVSDLVFAIESQIAGNFSWEAYSEHKFQSLMTSIICMGLGSLVVREAASVTTFAAETSKKAIALAVAREVVSHCVDAGCSIAINFASSKLAEQAAKELFSNFRKDFAQKVEKSRSLKESKASIKNSYSTLVKLLGEHQASIVINRTFQKSNVSKKINERLDTEILGFIQKASTGLSKFKAKTKSSSGIAMFSSAWNLIDIIGKVAKYAGLGVSVANIAIITENAMEQLAQNLAREAAKSEEQKSSDNAPLSRQESAFVESMVKATVGVAMEQTIAYTQKAFTGVGCEAFSSALSALTPKKERVTVPAMAALYDKFFKNDSEEMPDDTQAKHSASTQQRFKDPEPRALEEGGFYSPKFKKASPAQPETRDSFLSKDLNFDLESQYKKFFGESITVPDSQHFKLPIVTTQKDWVTSGGAKLLNCVYTKAQKQFVIGAMAFNLNNIKYSFGNVSNMKYSVEFLRNGKPIGSLHPHQGFFAQRSAVPDFGERKPAAHAFPPRSAEISSYSMLNKPKQTPLGFVVDSLLSALFPAAHADNLTPLVPDFVVAQKTISQVDTAEDISNLHGGKLALNIDKGTFKNYCAIRMSHVINQTLGPIPVVKNSKGERQTVSDKHGRQYIYRTSVMKQYLVENFPSKHVSSEGLSTKEFETLTLGKNGICFEEFAPTDPATSYNGHIYLCKGEDLSYARDGAILYFWEWPKNRYTLNVQNKEVQNDSSSAPTPQ